MEHMDTFHSKLKCTKCEIILEGHQALSVHMKEKHTDFCEPCGYPLETRVTHNCPAVLGSRKPKQEDIVLGKKVKIFRSSIVAMPDKSFLCLECGFSSAEIVMARHDSIMHKHIPCNHCHVTCLGRANLVEHLRICHPLVCTFCGTHKDKNIEHSCAQILSGDQSFFQHIPVKYRPNFCRICFEPVSYGIGYRNHLARKHSMKVEPLKAKPKGNQKVLNKSTLKKGSDVGFFG